MPVSATRRGIDNDPERELRFRRIEQELDARALANNQTGASAMRRGKSSTPRVTGLSLDNAVVGGIAVKWGAVDIPDVQKYQLQYSIDDNFLAATTSTLYSTHFQLPDASPETPYYVRVRAVDSKGQPGGWSSTLNSETGQASVSHLADGSASNIIVKTKTQGFDPDTVDGAGTTIGRYLRTVVNFPVAAETLLIGLAKGTLTYEADDDFFIRLKVDGSTKVEYENSNDLGGAATSIGVNTVPGLSVPVLIPSGQHEFILEIEVVGTTTYVPSFASIAIWQVRK